MARRQKPTSPLNLTDARFSEYFVMKCSSCANVASSVCIVSINYGAPQAKSRSAMAYINNKRRRTTMEETPASGSTSAWGGGVWALQCSPCTDIVPLGAVPTGTILDGAGLRKLECSSMDGILCPWCLLEVPKESHGCMRSARQGCEKLKWGQHRTRHEDQVKGWMFEAVHSLYLACVQQVMLSNSREACCDHLASAQRDGLLPHGDIWAEPLQDSWQRNKKKIFLDPRENMGQSWETDSMMTDPTRGPNEPRKQWSWEDPFTDEWRQGPKVSRGDRFRRDDRRVSVYMGKRTGWACMPGGPTIDLLRFYDKAAIGDECDIMTDTKNKHTYRYRFEGRDMMTQVNVHRTGTRRECKVLPE